ncbi:MAG: 50S ribosomal protein L30 [Candidatus Bathyarchaeia archaeon]|jgi:large subunit ribosomal protein L30
MTQQETDNKSIIAVRIRGVISARKEARDTLELLHLNRNNYAVLIDSRPAFIGMLKAVQGYVSWGEASKEAVNMLIKQRGRLLGNKKLTEEYLQKIGHKTLEDLAEAVFDCRVEYWRLPNIQPVFRLTPPTKGFRGNIKKAYRAGGAAGYQGEKISELIKRMV